MFKVGDICRIKENHLNNELVGALVRIIDPSALRYIRAQVDKNWPYEPGVEILLRWDEIELVIGNNRYDGETEQTTNDDINNDITEGLQQLKDLDNLPAYAGLDRTKYSEEFDPVFKPKHYNIHPGKCVCGKTIECVEITEWMSFNLGNATKYIWRCGKKGDPIEDLQKAKWYIDREIKRLSSK